MSYQLAPAEILLQIFEHLPRNNKLTCASVCKAWYMPALQQYYQHAILSGHRNKEKWLSLAKQNYRTTQHQLLDVGGLVKCLTITDFDMPAIHLGKYDFLDILSFVPFVKKIGIKKPSHRNSDALFRYLMERERMLAGYWYESEIILEYLTLENGHWGQHIEGIDYSASASTEMHSYFKCQYNFRKSLKVLKIRNPEDVYYWSKTEKTYVSALMALREFTSLTHIYLVNEIGGYQSTGNPGGGEGLNIFFSTLESCPNLISIHLNDKNITKQPSSATLNTINNLRQQDKPHSRLQFIELWISELNISWIKSLLWYYPLTGLKKMDLHITSSTHFSKWIETINKDLLIQFGDYVGMHIDNAMISFAREGEGGVERSSTVQAGLLTSMFNDLVVPPENNKLSTTALSRFALFMDLFLNDENNRDVHLYISRVGSLNDGEPDLMIQKTLNKFMIWYDTGSYADVFARLKEIYAIFYTDKRRKSSLKGKNPSVTIFWVEGYSISIGHCAFMLQNILTHHAPPYVDQVIFSKPDKRGYQYSIEGSSQEKLEEDSRIKFKFDGSNSTPTYKSLESITIKHLQKLEESSLNYLAEEHKYIKVLKMINCSLQVGYGSKATNQEEEEGRVFMMDFKKFIHLRKFVLDVSFLNGRNCRITIKKNGDQQGEKQQIDVYPMDGQNHSLPYASIFLPPNATFSTKTALKLDILNKDENMDELVLCYKKESQVIATFHV